MLLIQMKNITINNVPMEPYNSLYFENFTTQIPKKYDVIIVKIVVNTEPIDIKDRFLSCLVPNLNKIEVVIKIITITKEYLPISINEIFSDKIS